MKNEAAVEATDEELQALIPQSYYLASGEIVFIYKEDKEQHPNAVRSNAVVMSPNGSFNIHQLGQVQQALQHSLFQRMGKEASELIQPVDVVIISLIPLGEFTKAQFEDAKPQEELVPA